MIIQGVDGKTLTRRKKMRTRDFGDPPLLNREEVALIVDSLTNIFSPEEFLQHFGKLPH